MLVKRIKAQLEGGKVEVVDSAPLAPLLALFPLVRGFSFLLGELIGNLDRIAPAKARCLAGSRCGVGHWLQRAGLANYSSAFVRIRVKARVGETAPLPGREKRRLLSG